MCCSQDHDPTDANDASWHEEYEETEEMALQFWSSFANSVMMIIVTELGDKTFFIAAIMAMRYPRLVVFAGAAGALALMTVLSTLIGFALPSVLPRKYTHYASAVLFAYFGYKLLGEAYQMQKTGGGGGMNEELEEAEQEVAERTREHESSKDLEGGAVGASGKVSKSFKFVSLDLRDFRACLSPCDARRRVL